MDIESIIKKIVDKNFSIYEQERLTVLNALLGNLDILMNKSDQWFGKSVPEEYSRVIRSLFSLSAFLLEKKNQGLELSKIEKYHDISIYDFLNQFVNELKYILDLGEMKISSVDNKEALLIRSSEVLLRDAFYNIFFSVYPFMKKDSSCLINLVESRLNISVEFFFENLSPVFPGASEIKKNIYSYRQGNIDKIGIGIDSAIVNLRNAGVIIRLNELQFKDSFSMTLMFPALDFYSGLEHVRGADIKPDNQIYSGDILLQINDPFLKLFITDTLHEHGYSITSISSDDVLVNPPSESLKALVIEYNEETIGLIANNNISTLKKIMICNGNELNNKPGLETFVRIYKPFNIEELIEHIENG